MSQRAANTNGSSVTQLTSQRGAREDTHPVVVRVPVDLLTRLDDAVKRRHVRVPRHTWLLEAIIEKLDREQTQGDKIPRAKGRRHGT